MGRFHSALPQPEPLIIDDLPLLDSEFDSEDYDADDYERVFLAGIQPHHFEPSRSNS